MVFEHSNWYLNIYNNFKNQTRSRAVTFLVAPPRHHGGPWTWLSRSLGCARLVAYPLYVLKKVAYPLCGPVLFFLNSCGPVLDQTYRRWSGRQTSAQASTTVSWQFTVCYHVTKKKLIRHGHNLFFIMAQA